MAAVNMLIIVFTLFTSLAHATMLSDLAGTLQAGEWAELSTQDAEAAFTASNSIFEFTDEMVWDGVREKCYFIGTSDPNNNDPDNKFVAYDAASNSWQIMPDPSFMPGSSPMHAYDHHAIDPLGNRLWYLPFGGSSGADFYQYDLETETWQSRREVYSSGINYVPDASAITYFPEINRVVFAGWGPSNNTGQLALYNPENNTWSLNPNTYPDFGGIHNWMEYNPVHKMVWFGGGNRTNRMFRLSPDGSIDESASTPGGLNMNVSPSLMTVDPVSGDFLIFGDNSQLWKYDPVADNWSQIGSGDAVAPFTNPKKNPVMFHTVAAPINTYGVVMVAQWRSGGSKVWLYKHAENANVNFRPQIQKQPAASAIQIFPNPSVSHINIVLGSGITGLGIFNTGGQRIVECCGTNDPLKNMAKGIYFLKAVNGGRIISKKIVIEK